MTVSLLDHLAECCPGRDDARRALEQEAPLVKPPAKLARKPAKKVARR